MTRSTPTLTQTADCWPCYCNVSTTKLTQRGALPSQARALLPFAALLNAGHGARLGCPCPSAIFVTEPSARPAQSEPAWPAPHSYILLRRFPESKLHHVLKITPTT